MLVGVSFADSGSSVGVQLGVDSASTRHDLAWQTKVHRELGEGFMGEGERLEGKRKITSNKKGKSEKRTTNVMTVRPAPCSAARTVSLTTTQMASGKWSAVALVTFKKLFEG